MKLESAVLPGSRDELARIDGIGERAAAYRRMVDAAHEWASAFTSASVFDIDDIVGPVETRQWIADGLKSVPDAEPLRRGRRTFLDTWQNVTGSQLCRLARFRCRGRRDGRKSPRLGADSA